MHVTRALEEHPPLPSEDTQGWKGLHPAENAKTHDHNHGHDHSEHAGHPNHGVPSTAATPAATKEHDHSAQGAAPSSAEKPAVAPQEHDHTSHARHPEQEAPSQKDSTTSYSCPMHPELVSDKPGRCPDCGMNLEKKR